MSWTGVHSDHSRRAGWKLLALLVIILCTAILLHVPVFGDFFNRQHLRATFEAISGEPWAGAAFMGSFALGLAIGVPASLFTLLGGVVFGVWPGALYNWVGTVVGSSLAFFLGRYLGREFFERVFDARLRKLDEAIGEKGFWAIFFMRLVPVVPFALSNFAAGFTRVSFVHYVAATGLAIFPGLTVATYFAHAIWSGTGDRRAIGHVIVASLLMLVLVGIPWLVFRRRERDPTSRSL